ncbi:4-(cytidine 5'-diphospho)-2-C-methyl-D-erythritol kinase [Sulfoacidibacillus thermotolerans]|uniref:4-diphosphocytidyl-2-C-methyl-D-erythritol kinase n=1 Tax=Sulfoacidibacillus thermotolerans TaxID=1765684 RepID=A0A2U3DAY0_SULT2|nr:4-(cytidine 5'-diphospho)-2-C-methyl-D-erythritol kinase [Sulfoacidibacillus thermotolerans]PWI58438.1 4-(cytidine 5'-diphospho)-2-C-methyl-D-erythritol kinase [Sulfoacidibacillus thermotolerans]
MIFEKARAKINLTLDVLYKRPDGYHEVEMVMQTVDFCDYLSLTPRQDQQIVIRSSAPYIPTDERNLAYKAAEALRNHVGIRRGVEIDIDKRIPVAAGLAGGSADAAAVLRGLNHLWQLRLNFEELSRIGEEVGSDVPFCIYGGTAVVRGRGERVEPVALRPAFWVVLAKPPVAVSTAEIYHALDVQAIAHHPRAKEMMDALRSEDVVAVAKAAGNVLEPVCSALYPETAKVKEQLIRLGSQVTLMSGSGPTVFGLFEREQRARRAYNTMRATLKEVYLCQTC